MLMLVRLLRACGTHTGWRPGPSRSATGRWPSGSGRWRTAWSMRVVPVLARAEEIVVPKVVGLVRPTILLPVSAITCLSPDELEMILAHELAHVRRHDMWVNLAQRLAEVVLFFNPALVVSQPPHEHASRVLLRRADLPGDVRLGRPVACPVCLGALADRGTQQAGRRPRRRHAHPVETGDLAALAAAGRSPSDLRRRVARLFGEPLPEPVRLSRGGLLTLVVVAAVLFTAPTAWRSAATSVAAPATDAFRRRAEKTMRRPTNLTTNRLDRA